MSLLFRPDLPVCLALCSAVLAGCFPEVPYKGGDLTEGELTEDGIGGGDDACASYLDADGDGVGTGDPIDVACGTPGYADTAGDCDDTNADVFPGAPERCNDADDDCDGVVDNDIVEQWYLDGDGDGFGDAAQGIEDCDPGPGYVVDDTDCDDLVDSTYPGADEVCNDVDDNCDGDVDGGALDATAWYDDLDGDSFGDPATEVLSCDAPSDTAVAAAGDCDDGDAEVHPDALEVCDTIDNDCDGDIDDADDSLDASAGPVSWADTDGDGFGDAAVSTQTCVVPSGFVEDDTDCDDGEAAVNPAATEVCDSIDNDCDGDIDDADDSLDPSTTGTVSYADTDSDGFGDAAVTTTTCVVPSGYVTDDTDCDDLVATTYPGADEYCNTVDDDCDGATDESAVDAPSWYDDLDADGYGDSSTVVVQCEAPSSASASVGGDCDDSDAAVRPDATEVCDSIDNDCDGDIDDADSSLDASTGISSWADADGDGYGDAAVATQTCVVPTGYVEDDSDCDDGAPAINPAATEVCDSIDNDCDGDIDDADSNLDPSTTGSTFYADTDGDGYGDASASTLTCLAGSGFVADDTDCDDTDAAVQPGATEVCNGVDDDCDTLIDDDDPGVDTSTFLTWYADTDGDGLGDAASTAQACDAPSGYVADDTDCDDTSTSDIDGDGTQDCDDDDIDGDGLRNTWDVDPEDDSIVRGPTGGLGTDGSVTASGSEVWGTYTLLASSASAGATTVTVDDASAFSSGDELLILDQQGSDAGQYEFVFVDSVSSSTLTIEPPLTLDWDASDVVLVQEVPHYTSVTVSGTVSADAWEGEGGGVIAFRATDAVTISGTFDLSGLGYRGGASAVGQGSGGFQGESYLDEGSRGVRAANEGGGGSRSQQSNECPSGGGGAHASDGDDGGDMWSGYALGSYGGDSYGSATMDSLFFGSGGGAGTADSSSDGRDSRNVTGAGGDGGGILAIFSATSITANGDLDVGGLDGGDASWGTMSSGGELGGGGGGAGGSLWLAAPTVTLGGSVELDGGEGGTGLENYPYYTSYQTTPYGGDGSEGRLYVESSTSFSNTSGATATTGTYTD